MKSAKIFYHLDIMDAYTHLPVDEDFSQALTLNTPTHGLIYPLRAVYGAANMPAVWQQGLGTVVQDLPTVCNFYDDLLVLAETFEEPLLGLETVLERIERHGLGLNRSRCTFASSCVEFLGYKIDDQGIQKSDKHIKAIRDAPKPKTPEELELFIGKATYYSKFIPDLSTKSRPLRDILLTEPF